MHAQCRYFVHHDQNTLMTSSFMLSVTPLGALSGFSDTFTVQL